MTFNNFIPVFCMEEAGAAGGAGSGASDGGQAAGNQGGVPAGSATGPMSKVTVNDGTQGGNSGSATVPFGSGDANTGADNKVDYKALMGDFAEDPAFEAFKTEDGFDIQKIAKSYKETKALVGQKLGIPGEDASDEAKAEFYKALGVPEDAKGYEFGVPEDLPEKLKEAFDEDDANKWAERFKKYNIPADAAKALRQEFINDVAEQYKEMEGDIEKSGESFDKIATEMFGDKKEQVLKDANVLLQKYVPEDLRADIEKSVPDSVLLAMAAAITGETKHLTGEDKAIGGDAGASGETEQQLRERARKIMQDPAYNSPFAKGPEEHDRLKKEVRGIYQRMDQIKKAS